MEPEILVFLIPIFGLLTGMLAIFLKHREKMAGLDGKAQPTVQLLTETLEKQHDRIQQLQQRVETLEMIVTDENAALQQARRGRISLPDAEEPDTTAPASPRRRTSTS